MHLVFFDLLAGWLTGNKHFLHFRTTSLSLPKIGAGKLYIHINLPCTSMKVNRLFSHFNLHCPLFYVIAINPALFLNFFKKA